MSRSRCRLFALQIVAGVCIAGLPGSASAEWRNSLEPKGEPAASFTLATDGQTDYVIVIPGAPTTQDQKAAKDLAHWLGEMTGANFPVVADSEAPRETEISIGQTNRLEKADVRGVHAHWAQADLAAEGYSIGVAGKRLYLLGGRKRGPINAVYALLEEDLGCRWYPTLNAAAESWLSKPIAHSSLPDPTANRIPRMRTLRFQPVPRSYAPLFMYRAPGYSNAGEPAWALRNRTRDGHAKIPEEWGGNMNWRGLCHEMGRLVPPEKYFEKHPEYHALIDGKRSPRQLCMTNPEVTKILTDELLRRLRETPGVDFADVSPNDGGGHCACPECDAMNKENGSPSASQIFFVNKVAEEVSKEFPHIRLSSAAYMDSKNPPTKIRCHKNVAIFLANDAHAWSKVLVPFTEGDWEFSKGYRKAIVDWTNICDTVFIWDYFCNFQHYLAPMPNLHVLEPSVRFYADHKIKGIQMQGVGYIKAGEFAPLRTWVIAKSLWDPSLSVDDLIHDFIWGYYKEAAPAIVEYRALLDRVSTPHRDTINSICFGMVRTGGGTKARFLNREFLEQATAIFDRALKMDLRPEVRRRVEIAKLSITYVKLCKGGGVTDEPFLFQTDEDYSALVEEFKAVVEREKISHYAEGKPMPGWLAEKEALYAPLPENVVYDLYLNLDRAKAENCRKFKRDSIQKEDQTLLVILQHPPEAGVGDATFEIPLPALEDGKNLVLRSGTCFSQPTENGVRFAVLVDGDEVWASEQQTLAPADLQLGLSRWAGKTISVTLRVDAMGNGAYDWSSWVRPQVRIVVQASRLPEES